MRRGRAATQRNRNVQRLLKDMKRMSEDINDHEICRRFEILLKGGNEVDIQANVMNQILEDPFSVNERDLPEIYLMYFRHFRFQRKREKTKLARQQQEESPGAAGVSKTTRKKSGGRRTKKEP